MAGGSNSAVSNPKPNEKVFAPLNVCADVPGRFWIANIQERKPSAQPKYSIDRNVLYLLLCGQERRNDQGMIVGLWSRLFRLSTFADSGFYTLNNCWRMAQIGDGVGYVAINVFGDAGPNAYHVIDKQIGPLDLSKRVFCDLGRPLRRAGGLL